MKTKQQIKDKMVELKNDVMSFKREALVDFLTEEEGNSFGFSAVEGTKWEQRELTRESVLEKMKDYMDFAIEKAIDERGISAGRSINKMQMWLWIIEEDAVLGELPRKYFYWYGLPALIKICEHFDWDWRAMVGEHTEYIGKEEDYEDDENWYVYAREIKEKCGIKIEL